MKTLIKEIHDSELKSNICNDILRALPDWFGIDLFIDKYAEQVRPLPFYAAFDKDKAVGFIALMKHNPFTAEIHVMGIFNEYHKQGIGKTLVGICEDYCKENSIEFLTVKTVDESRASESYEKTRRFYLSVGFKPLEVFPLFWDENNPCLFMVKSIK
jgi:ribosomal protein S18 acetylase RimI-like enzyme